VRKHEQIKQKDQVRWIDINSIPCRFAKHASQHPIQKKRIHLELIQLTMRHFFEFLVIFLIGIVSASDLLLTCPNKVAAAVR